MKKRCLRNLAATWVLLLLPGWGLAQPRAATEDPVLSAMLKELERSRALRLASLDPPYFIEYALEDARSFQAVATLGAIVARDERRYRAPRVQVRAGDYDFDNTNYVFSDFFSQRGQAGAAPLDDDPLALQTFFWLNTDAAYKGAVAAIARKRAALKSLSQPDNTPDFSRAEPVEMIRETRLAPVDARLWTERARKLSGVFADYPAIIASALTFGAIQSTSYLANSEGTVLRYADNAFYLRIRAEAQARDGMMLRNAEVAQGLAEDQLPAEAELERIVRRVGEDLEALVNAPVGDAYVGPVLLEGIAAPQFFAQVLGENLWAPRRPVPEPGRNIPFQPSELEGRIGSRILPEWISVVDDPGQTGWHGRPLFGHYLIDLEGVKPERVEVVRDGVLRSFLTTRQPSAGNSASNGHARLPGPFGAKQAAFGNLFIGASETSTSAGLRRKLLEMCAQRRKDYGLIIRKLDFPSSASLEELRSSASRAQREGQAGRLVSAPILAYRVYPDGREELVRGLEFRGVTARALRDIIAASDESIVFSFMGNSAPLSLMGAPGYVATQSVVAPAVLFEELELRVNNVDLPKPPVVPPPDLVKPD